MVPLETAHRNGIGIDEFPMQKLHGRVELVDIEGEGNDRSAVDAVLRRRRLANASGMTVKSAEIFMLPVSRMRVTRRGRMTRLRRWRNRRNRSNRHNPQPKRPRPRGDRTKRGHSGKQGPSEPNRSHRHICSGGTCGRDDAAAKSGIAERKKEGGKITRPACRSRR